MRDRTRELRKPSEASSPNSTTTSMEIIVRGRGGRHGIQVSIYDCEETQAKLGDFIHKVPRAKVGSLYSPRMCFGANRVIDLPLITF